MPTAATVTHTQAGSDERPVAVVVGVVDLDGR